MVCNSIFQLFTAIAIRLSFMKDREVDLILTDSTPAFEQLTTDKRLNLLFHKVYYREVNKNLNSLNRLEKSRYFRGIMELFPAYYIKKVWQLEEANYNELYFSMFNEFNIRLQSYMYRKNKQLKTHLFEDGISTYIIDPNYKWTIPVFLRNILQVKGLEKTLTDIYLFEPQLMCVGNGRKIVKIPNVLEIPGFLPVFDEIMGANMQEIHEKFIFFEESFYGDGYTTNDSFLIDSLWNWCHKNNFILKHHPRNTENRFADKLPTIEFPMFWEHYFLKQNFNDKVIVTVSSNTAFVPYILAKKKPTIVLLYKIFNGTSPILGCGQFENYVEKYKEYTEAKLYIPQSVDENRELIEKMRKDRKQYEGSSFGAN